MNNFRKVFISSDHNGFVLKDDVAEYLKSHHYEVEDLSNQELDPEDDFPIFAAKAANSVLNNPDSVAILICGSGQGMCMAANRFRGIRASLVWNASEAKLTRNDNDANIMCLPAHLFKDGNEDWKNIIDSFLLTPFAAAPKYKRRNKMIDEF